VVLPSLTDARYEKTVVLLIEYAVGSDVLGVILNRQYVAPGAMSSESNELNESSQVQDCCLRTVPIPNNDYTEHPQSPFLVRHVNSGLICGSRTKVIQKKPIFGGIKLRLEADVDDPRYDTEVVYLGEKGPRESECRLEQENIQETPECIICHGFARWSPGELEGAMHMGLWGWMEADKAEIFCSSTAFEGQWQRLVNSQYLNMRCM